MNQPKPEALNGLPRLLVVDDDKVLLESLQDILSDAGFDVRVAENGAQAGKLLKTVRFSLALFDFQLPDSDGLKLAGKAHRQDRRLPILLMSGHVTEEWLEEQDTGTVVAFLRKPIDPKVLVETIYRALASAKRS